ncbi:MAG: L-seryl-tRNA(Sec) selenium transferase [Anaerolineae bacterium]|nr:MAG: L-seryl-tRNA(Sec) selenium transferase [Anaerolineae bacterium]
MSDVDLSALPSVDRLLHSTEAAELIAEYGRPLTLEAMRQTLEEQRARLKAREVTLPTPDNLLRRVEEILCGWVKPTLLPVVNATGVILHTNLGRAPLSEAALNAIQGVSQGYSSLEYDLDSGQRGSRYLHAEDLLKKITGAEAALVVNNNAAALMLALAALARGKKVLIGRTQLVEIGGGFRIPEVMKQSGARLAEVGATNRVHLEDYATAIEEGDIRLVMRAHRSNFRIIGFHSEPDLAELTQLAHRHDLPVLDDLGSGTLLATERFGLQHEMMVQESLAAGADLVCFSGDKLLGGPQAGILIGRADLIAKIRKHPMARAVRADKLALAALAATLLHYLKDEAEREIPIWQMISTDARLLHERARHWAATLNAGEVVEAESAVGGGSLPGDTLPTWALALESRDPEKLLEALRHQRPPIVGRIHEGRVLLDPRTVLPQQDGALLQGVQNALDQSGHSI